MLRVNKHPQRLAFLIMKKQNTVNVPKGEKLRILQLTDMQIIDSSQCRRPDRLSPETMVAWSPLCVEKNCYSHIRDLVTQTRPHLIIITGDIVYGEFDDSGRILRGFASFMDSLGIPWAPTFGNHDKESKIGIDAICNIFEASDNCLFGTETDDFADGESNYSIKIYQDGELIQLVYMLDSKGCTSATPKELIRPQQITENQCCFIESKAMEAKAEAGKTVDAIAAWHIPTQDVFDAFEAKGYPPHEGFVIGVTVPAYDGDFGAFFEKKWKPAPTPENFAERLSDSGVWGVFFGHDHLVNASVLWKNIRWTFGLKTATYDYRPSGSLGGTLIEIDKGDHTVRHIPTVVVY